MKNPFSFELVQNEGEFPEDPPERPEECSCGSDMISVEIECGSVYVICADCKKGKHEGFEDALCAGPVKFRFTVEPCSCNFMVQSSCDCDRYLIGAPVLEGEGMDTDREGPASG
jgi:hypothetical protein